MRCTHAHTHNLGHNPLYIRLCNASEGQPPSPCRRATCGVGGEASFESIERIISAHSLTSADCCSLPNQLRGLSFEGVLSSGAGGVCLLLKEALEGGRRVAAGELLGERL